MTGNVWEWVDEPWGEDNDLVRKGGSYLCHDSYCNRYRVSARDHSKPDDATGNIGFRCRARSLAGHTCLAPSVSPVDQAFRSTGGSTWESRMISSISARTSGLAAETSTASL